MTSDPLAIFYRHPAKVERRRGTNAHGDLYEAPDSTALWKIRTTSELVVTNDGRQVATIATLTGGPTIRAVPIGSKVTLPAKFGGATGLVVVQGLHDVDIDEVPAFYQIQLERLTISS